MCGENWRTGRPSRPTAGSSPRVRGKRQDRKRHPGRKRLIPACAGKTPTNFLGLQSRRAHPRVCGENFSSVYSRLIPSGSSPRVRGKLLETLAGTMRSRLIPACAGKTRARADLQSTEPAHPRVCGENSENCHSCFLFPGSSPRVRGKRGDLKSQIRRRRLIPACAGKAHFQRYKEGFQRAHPRVCGENGQRQADSPSTTGSSPRVRGKPTVLERTLRGRGLIPACAGKTNI